MWKIGICVVVAVYCIEIITAFIVTKIMTRKEKSSYVSKRVSYVLKLVLGIYLIPIIVCAGFLVSNSRITGLIIPMTILSAFPIGKFIIVPLSDRYGIKLNEKEFGKDSEEAKLFHNHIGR